MQSLRASSVSFSVYCDVASNTRDLNGDKVRRSRARNSGSMRWLYSNLSCVLERENLGTVRVQGAVIDPSLASRAELDHFHKRVLCGRCRVAHGISKRGGRS